MHYLEYNELKQHGTDDFPMGYYYVDEQHPRYFMPYHWHKECEIIRIIEGNFPISLDDSLLEAKSGDIIFIQEGILHGGIPHHCIYECAVFDLQTLIAHGEGTLRYIRQITGHNIYVKSLFTRGDSELCDAVDSLFCALHHQETAYELNVIGSIYSIFGLIFRKHYYGESMGDSRRNLKQFDQLKTVLEYIERYYAQNITLEKLASQAGMSSKYFCRYFKTILHKTPIEYLNYYRVEKACYELMVLDQSVTESGYRCGFQDTGYFIKVFKKYKGITPKQYRLTK